MKNSTSVPTEHPEFIYRVAVNVSPNGIVQKNIFKNSVASVTDKHFIIAKNNYNMKAVHVDRHLVGGELHANVGFEILSGSGWCLEDAIEETYEFIKELIVSEFFKKTAKLNAMLVAMKENEPLVTERDTNEYD